MSQKRPTRYPQYEVDMTQVYTGLQSQKAAADAARAQAAADAETARKAAEAQATADAEAAKKAAEGAK